MDANIKLSAPWQRYYNKLAAIFGADDEIELGELKKAEGAEGYTVDMVVKDYNKYVSLDRKLNKRVNFGNVGLTINLYNESDREERPADIYLQIFARNPHFADIGVRDAGGFTRDYVLFKNEVIQFFEDNLADFNGMYSGLTEDIAREIFEDNSVSFCTDTTK